MPDEENMYAAAPPVKRGGGLQRTPPWQRFE